MDVALHHITEGIIDQAVPLDEGLVPECSCHDVHDVMSAAAGRARVTRVPGAFVNNFQRFGLQGLRQAGANLLDAVTAHVREKPS